MISMLRIFVNFKISFLISFLKNDVFHRRNLNENILNSNCDDFSEPHDDIFNISNCEN